MTSFFRNCKISDNFNSSRKFTLLTWFVFLCIIIIFLVKVSNRVLLTLESLFLLTNPKLWLKNRIFYITIDDLKLAQNQLINQEKMEEGSSLGLHISQKIIHKHQRGLEFVQRRYNYLQMINPVNL